MFVRRAVGHMHALQVCAGDDSYDATAGLSSGGLGCLLFPLTQLCLLACSKGRISSVLRFFGDAEADVLPRPAADGCAGRGRGV